MKKQFKLLMCQLFTLAMLVVSPICASASTTTNDVSVRIRGDFPTIGTMQVSIFQSLEDFFRTRPLATIRTPVDSPEILVTFTNVPAGRYIIRATHDHNDDGKMNSNAFGIPTEAAAFFNPAGKPDVPVRAAEALTEVNDQRRDLEIRIPRAPGESKSFGIGVMTMLSSNPYRGGDTVVRVLPLITFVGERLYVLGPRAGYNLVKKRFVNINAVAEYKFAGDAFEDEKFLEGMENREDTLMAGFDFGVRGFGRWRGDLSALTDVFGRHDGQEINLSISRNFTIRKLSLTPGAGAVWRSDDYNNYYFGVQESEATAERPAYEPGKSIEWFARLGARYAFNETWSLLANFRYELLSDDVRESPIVDKDAVTSAFIGLNYGF